LEVIIAAKDATRSRSRSRSDALRELLRLPDPGTLLEFGHRVVQVSYTEALDLLRLKAALVCRCTCEGSKEVDPMLCLARCPVTDRPRGTHNAKAWTRRRVRRIGVVIPKTQSLMNGNGDRPWESSPCHRSLGIRAKHEDADENSKPLAHGGRGGRAGSHRAGFKVLSQCHSSVRHRFAVDVQRRAP